MPMPGRPPRPIAGSQNAEPQDQDASVRVCYSYAAVASAHGWHARLMLLAVAAGPGVRDHLAQAALGTPAELAADALR
jgi:hypothetical protein